MGHPNRQLDVEAQSACSPPSCRTRSGARRALRSPITQNASQGDETLHPGPLRAMLAPWNSFPTASDFQHCIKCCLPVSSSGRITSRNGG